MHAPRFGTAQVRLRLITALTLQVVDVVGNVRDPGVFLVEIDPVVQLAEEVSVDLVRAFLDELCDRSIACLLYPV